MEEGGAGDDGPDLAVVRPLLFGERHAPGAKASVADITPLNTGLGPVVRSVCRGIVDNLAEMMPTQMLDDGRVDKVGLSALSSNQIIHKLN